MAEPSGTPAPKAFLGLDSVFKITLFIGYMSLCVSQGILVYASKKDGQIQYNFTTVVLFTELAKLTLATSMFLQSEGNFSELLDQMKEHRSTWLLYFIPALLYCFYNNLTFVNLQFFDPTTFFVLSQFRVVVTALIYQALFDKKLTSRQWMSLVILIFGCVVKEVHKFSPSNLGTVPYLNWGLVLVQICCATFAGVYNEFLLKKKSTTSINLQNIFMYANSIIGNVVILCFGVGGRTLSSAIEWDNITPILTPGVLVIILNSSMMGIATAMFLKHLNSMLKSVASSLEVVGTAVVSYIVFGTDFGMNTMLSVVMVSCGVWLYSTSPIKNATVSAARPSYKKVEASGV